METHKRNIMISKMDQAPTYFIWMKKWMEKWFLW